MKKILLVTRPIAPPWDEASKNFAYFLAKNAKGFSFTLLTNGILPDLGEHVQQFPIYSSNHLGLAQKLQLLQLLPRRNSFDIMHFMLTPNALNTFAFKHLLRSKHTKTIQTIATLREDLYTPKQFKNILFADQLITYSDYAKEKLHSFGFSNVARIYPGIDVQNFVKTSKDAATCSQFRITPDDFVIAYPGEYTRLGATDDITKALPDLFARIPRAKFMFACRVKNERDAQKKAHVVDMLTKQGIIDRVIFTDTFSEMAKLYNVSDVVIFPVRDMKGKFDVPLAVIEAFACEKPVIISDLPILAEFATSGNSVIIKTGNTEQLITSLVDLFEHPEKRASIGNQARNYAQENFDIRNVAAQYEKVYQDLKF